jgi:metal-responsive CopG/Arc/MetJ family transcriptional regulator
MKSIANYSINVEVLKEFNEEVKDQTRSRLIEALIINFLVEYTEGITDIKNGDKSPKVLPNPTKEKESTIVK